MVRPKPSLRSDLRAVREDLLKDTGFSPEEKALIRAQSLSPNAPLPSWMNFIRFRKALERPTMLAVPLAASLWR